MSSKRHKIREMAMQVLFMWDAASEADRNSGQDALSDQEDADARNEALKIAAGAWDMRKTADDWVTRLAPQWPPRRQPAVDRNLLRLAVYELTSLQTPPKVVLDEAIELAKEFSTEQSASFVNGVLDAVLKEKQALLAEPAAVQPTLAVMAPEEQVVPAEGVPHAQPLAPAAQQNAPDASHATDSPDSARDREQPAASDAPAELGP